MATELAREVVRLYSENDGLHRKRALEGENGTSS